MILQSNGFFAAASCPSGADLRKMRQRTPTTPTIAARMAVDDRQVNDTATRAGSITVEIPSPVLPPTATNKPLLKARSFEENHSEMAPDIATYTPAAATPFRTRQRLRAAALPAVENPHNVTAVPRTHIVTAFRLPNL